MVTKTLRSMVNLAVNLARDGSNLPVELYTT